MVLSAEPSTEYRAARGQVLVTNLVAYALGVFFFFADNDTFWFVVAALAAVWLIAALRGWLRSEGHADTRKGVLVGAVWAATVEVALTPLVFIVWFSSVGGS
jgi:hypothetical protein